MPRIVHPWNRLSYSIHLRVSVHDLHALQEAAKHRGKSQATLLRWALREFLGLDRRGW